VGHNEQIQTGRKDCKIEEDAVQYLDQWNVSPTRSAKNAPDPSRKHIFDPQDYLAGHKENPPPYGTLAGRAVVNSGQRRVGNLVYEPPSIRAGHTVPLAQSTNDTSRRGPIN